MDGRPKDPVEAEVEKLRRSIGARIKAMSAKEKDAYYQSIADALKEAFNAKTTGPAPARPLPGGRGRIPGR